MNRSADRFSSQADRNSADSGAEYARSFERKWGFAFSKSKADLEEMEKKVTKKLRQLLDERELIMDILAKLDSNKLSAPTAMGMLQQSLAECAVCKSWRALAQSPLGDAAATTFVLASKLGGSKEVKEVKEEVKDKTEGKDQNQNGVTESAPPVSAAQVAAMEAQNETVNDSVTQMVDDPNVLKSEIDDIRKSVVSMSVGQPARTSTIVKEWLEQPAPEAPAPEEPSSDGGGEEEEKGEE